MVRMTDEERAKLAAIAKRRGGTYSSIIRWLVLAEYERLGPDPDQLVGTAP